MVPADTEWLLIFLLFIIGPKSVNGVENLKVVATITNTGDETLKILNDPQSPLSTLPANTFDITDSNGSRPAFTGIKVKYSLESAVEAGAFTVLAPGKAIDIEHNCEVQFFSNPGLLLIL